MSDYPNDLVVVVADGAIQQVVHAILGLRRPSIGIRDIKFEIVKDAMHDSGSEAAADGLLRGFLRSHQYAILVKDLEGSGRESEGGAAMEQSFKQFMEANGWVGRIETIVLEPEIESWIRFDSSAFAELIKGQARRRKMEASDLKTVVSRCVDKTGGWNALNKPNRPKEAFEGVLAEFGVVRSNSLYGKLAKHESLAGCQVLSFLKFKTLLQRWFAKDQQA